MPHFLRHHVWEQRGQPGRNQSQPQAKKSKLACNLGMSSGKTLCGLQTATPQRRALCQQAGQPFLTLINGFCGCKYTQVIFIQKQNSLGQLGVKDPQPPFKDANARSQVLAVVKNGAHSVYKHAPQWLKSLSSWAVQLKFPKICNSYGCLKRKPTEWVDQRLLCRGSIISS